MRLRISLAEGGPLRLPVQYNHLLQGLVYHNLDRVLSEWLHEEAHVLGKRRFKLFTFSRLFGKREMRNGHIGFAGPLHFYLGAVDARVLGSLAEHLLTKPAVRLGNSRCRVTEVGVEPEPRIDPDKPVLVKALAPITAYSTLQTPAGAKKTFLMVYDVEVKRVTKVLKIGRKHLDHIHNSVLEGELSPAQYKQLKYEVEKTINSDHDSVRFYVLRTTQYLSVEKLGVPARPGDAEPFL